MSRKDNIRQLIANHQRRLQILQEQKALQGSSVEPKILIEIEDIEKEIESLQSELEDTTDPLFEPTVKAKYGNYLLPISLVAILLLIVVIIVGYLLIASKSSSDDEIANLRQTGEIQNIEDFKKCNIPVASNFKPIYEDCKEYLGCPIYPAFTVSRIAEQKFQGGHLFWREDNNDVYIIYDRSLMEDSELFDGDWRKAPPEWQWDGSYSEGVGLTPPSNDLVEPTRGFGWIWRTHLGGPDGKLGWAFDKEYGYKDVAKAQTFERGLIFQASDPKVYCLLDTDVFFAER